MLKVGIPKEGQDYDAVLFISMGPQCNLKCVYCFPETSMKEGQDRVLGKIKKALMVRLWRDKSTTLDENFLRAAEKYFPDSCKQTEPFRIDASTILQVLEKTGKTFHLIFTGGEPFLAENFVNVCRQISKKHFVSVVTNLTDVSVGEFCRSMDPQRVISICASAHIKELEKTGLINRFIDHFLLCRQKGFQVIAQAIAYPPLAGEAARIKESFRNKGVPLTFSPFCGTFDEKEFPGAYSSEERKLFGFSNFDVDVHFPFGKVCNAGYNVGFVTPSGDIRTCFYVNETLGNIYEGIKFKNDLTVCPSKFCNCPFNQLDSGLFQRTIRSLNLPV